MGGFEKIIVIFRVKGGNQRRAVAQRQPPRFPCDEKRAVRMHNVEPEILHHIAVPAGKPRNTRMVCLAGHRNTAVQDGFIIIRRRVLPIIGRNVRRTVAKGMQAFAIAEHHTPHPVQRRRIRFAELTDQHRWYASVSGFAMAGDPRSCSQYITAAVVFIPCAARRKLLDHRGSGSPSQSSAHVLCINILKKNRSVKPLDGRSKPRL